MKPVHTMVVFLHLIFLGGIVLLTLLFFRNHQTFKNTSYLVNHTHKVIEKARELAIASKDVQFDAVRLLQVPLPVSRTEYERDKAAMNNSLETLRSLTSDNATQEKRIDSLGIKISELSEFLDAWVYTASGKSFTPNELNDFVNQRAQRRFDIDKIISDVVFEENSLLRSRELANTESIDINQRYYVAAGVFMLGILMSAYFITFHQFNKRKKAEAETKASEKRFHQFIDGIKDVAIVMTDAKGQIMNWHEGAAKLKGYSKEEVIGKHISIFYTPEAVQNGEPDHNLKMAAAHGSFETEGWRMRKDGTLFWADILLTAIYDEQGVLQGFIKVTRDYTLHQKWKEESERALKKEIELNHLKSSFVSMASHEFRNPLTIIHSSVSLVDKYISRNELDKADKHIQRIKSSISELMGILEEFLSLEKIDQGKVELKKEPLSIDVVLSQLCHNMEHLLKEKQRIEYHHDGSSETLVDQSALAHIITNLISNGIKYSPENTSVLVNSQMDDMNLTITVSDNGIGMSEEDQRHLFGRFFRASNTGSIKGTGLGLHIVKKYVDLHGGTIDVQSELNKGSTFTVTIPCI